MHQAQGILTSRGPGAELVRGMFCQALSRSERREKEMFSQFSLQRVLGFMSLGFGDHHACDAAGGIGRQRCRISGKAKTQSQRQVIGRFGS